MLAQKLTKAQKRKIRRSVRAAFAVPRGAKKLFVVEVAVEVRSRRELDQVIEDDPALAQTRIDALRLTSASLRGHSGTAAARAKALRATLTTLGAKVHILPLSNLNFLASDGSFTKRQLVWNRVNTIEDRIRRGKIRVQHANGLKLQAAART